MATHQDTNTNEPGQYPTTAWHWFGLPEQDFGSGAAGSPPPSAVQDQGFTNEPGQYPARDDFTGIPYSIGGMSGSGAPGSAGGTPWDRFGNGGPDQVTFSKVTTYKSQREPGDFNTAQGSGTHQATVPASVSGANDWTQANPGSYAGADDRFLPGIGGNMPVPGSSQYQTGEQDSSAHVMYGGWLKGKRPATSQHGSQSGPGT